MNNSIRWMLPAMMATAVWGCAATKPPSLSEGHINVTDKPLDDHSLIPAPVQHSTFLPPPQLAEKAETYTVVVNDVPVRELLFALARDAKVNVDVHPNINGNVTINAINQTLLQILNRVAEQVPLIYELQQGNLFISPDEPVLRNYKVDYVNMSRTSTNTVSVATTMATTGGSVAGGSSGDAGNSSSTSVTSTTTNDFWTVLIGNIQGILADSGTAAGATPPTTAGAAASTSSTSSSATQNVIANPISGVISVRARQKQHRQIQQFIDQVVANAQRQVLIEATIVEVELGDRYQSGIDWTWVRNKGGKLLDTQSLMNGAGLSTPPTFVMNYSQTSEKNNITAAIHMLETFGDTKVLSSPKIIAMNNQTALLKVVDEKVYFTVDVQVQDATDTAPEKRTYTSEIHTIPVGVVMSVTPQVNENGNVTLNIRPTITRITGYVTDPAPRLLAASTTGSTTASANFDNLIPEIQIREMESLLQVRSGQTVVLGGLMQNRQDKNKSGIPWLSSLPVIGSLFGVRDENHGKTELVIFLKPLLATEDRLRRETNAQEHYLPSLGELSPKVSALKP